MKIQGLFAAYFAVILAFSGCARMDIHSKNAPTKSHNAKKAKSKTHFEGVYDELISVERLWKDTPYKLGGASLSGADCSGFVQSVFREHFETDLPRNTVMQMQGGKSIHKHSLKAGDIVFFRTGQGPNGLHNGIYMADDEFIHLSNKYNGLKKVSLDNEYWKSKFIGARRYLP